MRYVCSVDKDFSLKTPVAEGKDLVNQFDSCSKWAKEEKPAEAPEVYADRLLKISNIAILHFVYLFF